LELRRAALGDEHPSTATTMGFLGNLLAGRGSFDEAEALLKRAIEIEAVRDNRSLDYARWLNDLGGLQCERCDYPNSEQNLRRAVEIRLEKLGDSHRDVATSLGNLGLTRMQLGDLAEAESLLRRAVDIDRATPDAELAQSLSSLACVLSARGDGDGAQA